MTGGLLQFVISGQQDIYLTINPQITFFKKVYRRYTPFSLELISISSDRASEYNNVSSFIIKTGDAVNKCYIEIELPNLIFSDIYITNADYIAKKKTDLNNLQINYTKWYSYYTNLLGYINIEVDIYRILYNLLQTDNITISALKTQVNQFNYKNKKSKDLYINNIDNNVYILINISEYIENITKLITTDTIYNSDININSTDILTSINDMYKNMNTYIDYYHSKYIYYYKLYTNKLNNTNINFNYAEYLGHNFFEYINLEIDGQEYTRYSNNILHINQMHNISDGNMENYLKMIGHTPELNTFNSDIKGNRKILIPLIFWFNKDTGACLPAIALQNSTIIINIKISKIEKIICFENYQQMFNELLITSIDNNIGFIRNTLLLYNTFNINKIEKSISYNCIYINDELLKIQYPDLTDDEILLILTTNGTSYSMNEITKLIFPNMSDDEIIAKNGSSGSTTTQYILNQIQWVHFMINIKQTIYSSIALKIGSYYPYINFNMYHSSIPAPQVKLITEVIFLYDTEREKFANSKLEYIIETFDEDVFTIKSLQYFNCELSFTKPCKELLWYLQPQIFYDGLTEYGQNTSLLYDYNKYFINDPILKHKLNLNNFNILLSNIDMNYYTYLLSSKYLNNILPNGVYYHSFCLYPEETQPSGTANLTILKGKQYSIQFNTQYVDEFNDFILNLENSNLNLNRNTNMILRFVAKSYELLIIHKESTHLLFS